MIKVTLNLLCPVSLCGGAVRLLPGGNEVDPAAWAQVEKHPITRALIEERSLVVEALQAPAQTDGGKQGKGGGKKSEG